MRVILYKDLSYTVIGLCMEVHNECGRYAREKKYSDMLEHKFIDNGISYKREVWSDELKERADFIVEGKIVVELKTKTFFEKRDYMQIQNYLQVFEKDLGILINFQSKYLKQKRVLRVTKRNLKNK